MVTTSDDPPEGPIVLFKAVVPVPVPVPVPETAIVVPVCGVEEEEDGPVVVAALPPNPVPVPTPPGLLPWARKFLPRLRLKMEQGVSNKRVRM